MILSWVWLVGGWAWGLHGDVCAPLIPQAWGDPGSRDKGKDAADWNKNAIRERGGHSRLCPHHVFCSLCYWNMKKQNHVLLLLVLIQGPQNPRSYSIEHREPLKASSIKCCPWLGRGSSLRWNVCCFLYCLPILHSSSVYQIQVTKCPKVSHTTVPLPVLFPLSACHSILTGLAHACSKTTSPTVPTTIS